MTAPSQQKLRVDGPVVVTANRLFDGAVVYRSSAGSWSTQIEDAEIANDIAAAKALLASATTDHCAVGPYVAPVALEAGHIRPGNLRERIRVAGPTFPLPSLAAA
jgi:Protein of unknown function (DUF2849)